MSIARPQLDQTIIEKCGQFIKHLQDYHSQYSDVNINIKGYLKNGNGVKILLENIYNVIDKNYWDYSLNDDMDFKPYYSFNFNYFD